MVYFEILFFGEIHADQETKLQGNMLMTMLKRQKIPPRTCYHKQN